jgi:hypothetical protein
MTYYIKASRGFPIPVKNVIIEFAFSHHIEALRNSINDLSTS